MWLVIAQCRIKRCAGKVLLHEVHEALVDHETFLFARHPVGMWDNISRPDDVSNILKGFIMSPCNCKTLIFHYWMLWGHVSHSLLDCSPRHVAGSIITPITRCILCPAHVSRSCPAAHGILAVGQGSFQIFRIPVRIRYVKHFDGVIRWARFLLFVITVHGRLLSIWSRVVKVFQPFYTGGKIDGGRTGLERLLGVMAHSSLSGWDKVQFSACNRIPHTFPWITFEWL